MRTHRLAALLGSVGFIGTIGGVVLIRPEQPPLATPDLAAATPSTPDASDARLSAPASPLLACSTAALPARPVPPGRIFSEPGEFWAAQQPIFDALPHLAKDDITKLEYFCPADFNKDDSVDDADALAFMQAWADESSPLFGWCDLNKDGFVDESDAHEFMRRFRESDCDPLPLTEYRPIIC
ncbi:MAG: hypothetical protein DYG92_02230 [Leptolyngbya sp. PLA1]|nr:hypothetical protein [Leptolyngbya sp. PLA1]